MTLRQTPPLQTLPPNLGRRYDLRHLMRMPISLPTTGSPSRGVRKIFGHFSGGAAKRAADQAADARAIMERLWNHHSSPLPDQAEHNL